MELCADIPALLGYLHNLHEIRVRVDSHAFHTCRFVLVAVLIVELIAMAVALSDSSLTPDLTPDPSPKGEGSRYI